MIDIHITQNGIESHIENELTVEVLTVLTVAIFSVCKQLNVSAKTFAAALLESDKELKNEED